MNLLDAQKRFLKEQRLVHYGADRRPTPRRDVLFTLAAVVTAVAASGEASEPPKTLPLEFVKRAELRPITERSGFTAFSVRSEDGQLFDVRDVIVALVELSEPHWKREQKK